MILNVSGRMVDPQETNICLPCQIGRNFLEGYSLEKLEIFSKNCVKDTFVFSISETFCRLESKEIDIFWYILFVQFKLLLMEMKHR